MIKQAISMPVTITAVSLAPGKCRFTFSPLPLIGRERTRHATLRTSGKVLHRRSGFAKPLFKPLSWPCKVPLSGSFHLGTRCTRKMLRTFRRQQMGPTRGTLTPLMSLPTEQATTPSTPPGCRGLGEQGPGADWASCPVKDGLGLGAGCALSHLPPGTQEGLGSSSKVTQKPGITFPNCPTVTSFQVLICPRGKTEKGR